MSIVTYIRQVVKVYQEEEDLMVGQRYREAEEVEEQSLITWADEVLETEMSSQLGEPVPPLISAG